VAIRSVRHTREVPPNANEHLAHRRCEMPEGHRLAQHAPKAPRMRQRTDQHVRCFAPRHVGRGELQPVPLNLLARRVIDLGRDLIATPLRA
jgi:hypothetical protein